MINRRYLNFKTYGAFLEKLNANQIPQDSIVFIQDKTCIWAHGKEYCCDNSCTTDLTNGVLTFSDKDDNTLFTVSIDGLSIRITDSKGNTSSATYILKDDFNNTVDNINGGINNIKTDVNYLTKIVLSQVDRKELSDVAFSGEYNDLKNRPGIPTTDDHLSLSSSNPVLNKVLTQVLSTKADNFVLDRYVTGEDFTRILSTKLDNLKAGRGIDITGRTISSTLDTDVYEMVSELGDPVEANENKIYILETKIGNDYSYKQYRVKNNQWVLLGDIAPTVDLTGYLTKGAADNLYQPIGNYLGSEDLVPYARVEDLTRLEASLGDYALVEYIDNAFQRKGDYAYKDYVDSTFVKRSEVYNPKQGEWGTDDSSGTGQNQIIHINDITVDAALSYTSANPVLNRAIANELDKKATKQQLAGYATLELLAGKLDKTALNNYVTGLDLAEALITKLDTLTAGEGISIIDNVISANLDIDTSVYLFVDELPVTNINDDKIYILGTEEDDQITYTQWKHQDNEWLPIGQLLATIDLSNYITRIDASNTFAPKGNYITTNTLELFRQDLENLYQRKGVYATVEYADNTYQPKGNYITSVDIAPYAKVTDLDEYATKLYLLTSIADFATKSQLLTLSDLVEETYLKILAVYTPSSGNVDNTGNGGDNSSNTGNNSGSGSSSHTTTIINNTYTIDVDQQLSVSSSNPVENRVITRALANKADVDTLSNYALKAELSSKADKSLLSDYATNAVLQSCLALKQDRLNASYGVTIDENNNISVTLDTNPYVIVSELPSFNINPNKIYLLETVVNGESTYTEYRRSNNTWVEVGVKDMSIDLSDYIKEADADRKYLIPAGTYLTPAQANLLYQPIGDDYALASEVEDTYQKKGNYVSTEDFEAMRINIDSVFQKKGAYALALDVQNALILLQQIIDQKYVLKEDVPMNSEYSISDPTAIPIGSSTGGGESSGSVGVSNMVTLSVSQYEALQRNNLVRENTYYFTYEDEEEVTTWGFGDTFPVLLTDGSTPDSIGTFPINLT